MSNPIGWCTDTINPIVGCSRVSAGCAKCWAERMAVRLAANPKTPQYKGAVKKGRWSGKTVLVESELEKPLHWKKPRRIFVCSMSDLFHEQPGLSVRERGVREKWIGQVFAMMAEAYWHTFFLLTKRAKRMAEWSRPICHYPRGDRSQQPVPGWPPNVWAGVSVEDQQTADERIPHLLRVNAAKRFVSYEPALGPVDLREIAIPAVNRFVCCDPAFGPVDRREIAIPAIAPPFQAVNVGAKIDALRGEKVTNHGVVYHTGRIDWVIAGGESGPGARPAQVEWFRQVRDHCRAAGTAFWFKQEGGLHGGGCLLDGVEHKELP